MKKFWKIVGIICAAALALFFLHIAWNLLFSVEAREGQWSFNSQIKYQQSMYNLEFDGSGFKAQHYSDPCVLKDPFDTSVIIGKYVDCDWNNHKASTAIDRAFNTSHKRYYFSNDDRLVTCGHNPQYHSTDWDCSEEISESCYIVLIKADSLPDRRPVAD